MDENLVVNVAAVSWVLLLGALLAAVWMMNKKFHELTWHQVQMLQQIEILLQTLATMRAGLSGQEAALTAFRQTVERFDKSTSMALERFEKNLGWNFSAQKIALDRVVEQVGGVRPNGTPSALADKPARGQWLGDALAWLRTSLRSAGEPHEPGSAPKPSEYAPQTPGESKPSGE